MEVKRGTAAHSGVAGGVRIGSEKAGGKSIPDRGDSAPMKVWGQENLEGLGMNSYAISCHLPVPGPLSLCLHARVPGCRPLRAWSFQERMEK